VAGIDRHGTIEMNPKRTHARDRRLAAVHEAGHIVIARAVGLEVGSAWIGPNTGKVAKRTWIGHVGILDFESKADDVSRRMVGVAGSVAAHLWCGGCIEDFFLDAMSKSDWYFAGCDPDEPDDTLMDAIREVGQMLARDGAGWQELIAESRRLIVASRTSV
jgi:hypothetical protein